MSNKTYLILPHKTLTFDKKCGIIIMVMTVIINSVVRKEAERNREMIAQYEETISKLPKGSLVCRKNEYYYLKYRKDGKVCDDYIGKDTDTVSQIREKIEQRKHCEKMLSALKKEQKAINKILEGF